MYRIKLADMIVYEHQVDIEYIKASLGNFKLYTCIDLFVEHTNADIEQTAVSDNKISTSTTYSTIKNNVVSTSVVSVFGASILGIILYKVHTRSSGQGFQREDVFNNKCPAEIQLNLIILRFEIKAEISEQKQLQSTYLELKHRRFHSQQRTSYSRDKTMTHW